MTFERTWKVGFSDTDLFGIAHYPRMIDAIHDTSDLFMESIGWPYWELIDEHELGLPVVSMDFDFEQQLQSGDEVTIELTTDVGDSSVRLDYQAFHDENVAFRGTEFRVCVPVGADHATPVPNDLRTALESAGESE
ncbi:acyl-CoA thioesterase [Natrarchaeobius sp. A-rgal3]|uniref:acyl-CoA thioesterase n=1 Tax=Natrarchaeobius versutus TaxID=1679078 RepID=UPI00350FF10E